MEFRLAKEEIDGVLANCFADYQVSVDPLSDESKRQVQYWIKTCQDEHPRCPSSDKILPTRVIDVRNDTLRLLDPSPSGTHPYVALSHCWGTCRSFLTTRKNLEDHKRGFNIQDLPTTFRDAVLATQAIGMAFLWIDSICIIQGDKDDWETEGSKMAGIYSNATHHPRSIEHHRRRAEFPNPTAATTNSDSQHHFLLPII